MTFPTFVLLLICGAIGYVFINYSWQDISTVGAPKEVKSINDVAGLVNGSPELVDSRPESEYMRRAAPRAVNLNTSNWNTQYLVVLSNWIPGTSIVVYDDADHHSRAVDIAKRLMANNCKPVYVLTGGIDTFTETVVPGIDNEKYQKF